MKLSYRLLLSLLLVQGSAMAAEPLFKVISSSPTIPADSYSATCTVDTAGRIVISRNTTLFKSGTALNSAESKTVKLSVANLRRVINEAAKGHITGVPLLGGSTHQYFAYQKPVKGVAKEILLLDKKGGLSNDSDLVEPLSKFIDGLCGNIAQ